MCSSDLIFQYFDDFFFGFTKTHHQTRFGRYIWMLLFELPGATRTNMRAFAYPAEDPNTLKTPAEIMPLYLYLMGDDSLNVNGQSLDAQPK